MHQNYVLLIISCALTTTDLNFSVQFLSLTSSTRKQLRYRLL